MRQIDGGVAIVAVAEEHTGEGRGAEGAKDRIDDDTLTGVALPKLSLLRPLGVITLQT